MAVARLEIADLRCIEQGALELDRQRNLITGANGAGKTSILEAAYVLGRGHSFRVRDNRRLIRHGQKGFLVRGEFAPGGANGYVGVAYSRGRLDVRIDGEAGRRASQLAECLPVEVIDASAHRLIDGGPGERRRFMDWALFHVEQDYMARWRDFRRVLVQRNQGLRNGIGDAELDIWDRAFVKAAVQLDAARTAWVERWGRQASAIAQRLLGSDLVLSYRSGAGEAESLVRVLGTGRAKERERGLTLAGPHRSDLSIRFGDGPARETASRGQQKLLAAALILGRLTDRLEHGNAGGLLLVDDPVAELDANALGRLIAELETLPVQMLVTAIERKSMQPLAAQRTFHVEQGVIEPA
jgi:DNA replication and repair protein RecF